MSPREKPGGVDGEAKRGGGAEATKPAAGNHAGPGPSSATDVDRFKGTRWEADFLKIRDEVLKTDAFSDRLSYFENMMWMDLRGLELAISSGQNCLKKVGGSDVDFDKKLQLRIGFLQKLLPLQQAFEEELRKKASAKKTPSETKRKRSQLETPTPGAPLTATAMDPRFGGGGVALLAAARERCELRPKQFFVAWSGALTLAWHGFPPEIEALKRDIARKFPALKPENPGSRWAKTTLGCLRDTERLTPEQLEHLGNICARFRSQLNIKTVCCHAAADGGDDSPPTTPGCVPVDTLSVITYECRSLERVVSEHAVRLRDAGTNGAPNDGQIRGGARETESRRRRRLDPPSAAELAVVDEVVAQFSDPKKNAKQYFFDAARDGSRESHYRGTKLGVTLAARVAGSLPRDLKNLVDEFRKHVDAALPGMYAWFDDESLHCTVRGLVD